MGPYFTMGDAIEWQMAKGDRWHLFLVKFYSNFHGTYLDWP